MSGDRMDRLAALTEGGAGLTPTELLDALWLANRLTGSGYFGATPVNQMPDAAGAGGLTQPPGQTSEDVAGATGKQATGRPGGDPALTLHLPDSTGAAGYQGTQVRLPAVPALRHRLALTRALHPLKRRVPVARSAVLDENRTATATAEAHFPVPVFQPASERWLDLALVVDESASMRVWRETIQAFRGALEWLGAFRAVQVWRLDTEGPVPVLRRPDTRGPRRASIGQPRELVDPTGRRAVLLATDGIGAAWQSSAMTRLLDQWARTNVVAIVQLLPEELWHRTKMRPIPARIRAQRAGTPTADWQIQSAQPWTEGEPLAGTPVLELTAAWLATWATLVGAPDGGWVPLSVFPYHREAPVAAPTAGRAAKPARPAAAVVNEFRAAASVEAFELACHLSAAPLTLPVMRLVQQAVLPDSEVVHLAEILLSDLVQTTGLVTTADGGDDGEPVYEFRRGVREHLLAALSRSEARRVLGVLADVAGPIARMLGGTLDFRAVVAGLDRPGGSLSAASRPFARVVATVLRGLGGDYRDAGDQLRAALALEPAPTKPTQPAPSRSATSEGPLPALLADLVDPRFPPAAEPPLTTHNPFALPNDWPPTAPLKFTDEDRTYYVALGSHELAFNYLRSELDPKRLLHEGRLVVVAGPMGSGKTSLINRCSQWIRTALTEHAPTLIDLRSEIRLHQTVRERVESCCSRLAGELISRDLLDPEAEEDIVKYTSEAAAFYSHVSEVLRAGAVLIIILPTTELVQELELYASAVRPRIVFFAETQRSGQGPGQVLRASKRAAAPPPIELNLGLLDDTDAWRLVEDRLSRYSRSLPALTHETITRMITSRHISIGGLQSLLYEVFEEALAADTVPQEITWEYITDFYFRLAARTRDDS